MAKGKAVPRVNIFVLNEAFCFIKDVLHLLARVTNKVPCRIRILGYMVNGIRINAGKEYLTPIRRLHYYRAAYISDNITAPVHPNLSALLPYLYLGRVCGMHIV